MKLMLSGIVLLALVTACGDDADTDSNTQLDSGTSETTADDEETTADDEETTSDDEETNDAAADDEETADDTATSDASTAPTIPPPPEPISCGDVDCPAPPWGTPCCVTAADVEASAGLNEGACGVDLSPVFGGQSACVEFNQPGELDESCPPMEIPDAPSSPGCCTSHGLCGTVDSFTGLGCVTTPPEFGGVLIPCGGDAGDAGSTSEDDAGTGGSGDDAGTSSGDDAGPTMSEPDAGETTEAMDSGSASEPALDASTSDASTGDASL